MFDEFVQSALRRKSTTSITFGEFPALMDALRDAQMAAYPSDAMGKIGTQLEEAYSFTCPKCGQLPSRNVIMGAMMRGMQGMSPGMAIVSIGGGNSATVAGGRCPGCGGETMTVIYDPRKVKGLTPLPDDGKGKSNAWCFVATACYGSVESIEVLTLRAFRDDVLLRSATGRWFVAEYYDHSPRLARWLSRRPVWRDIVRRFVLGPVVSLISAMQRKSES